MLLSGIAYVINVNVPAFPLANLTAMLASSSRASVLLHSGVTRRSYRCLAASTGRPFSSGGGDESAWRAEVARLERLLASTHTSDASRRAELSEAIKSAEAAAERSCAAEDATECANDWQTVLELRDARDREEGDGEHVRGGTQFRNTGKALPSRGALFALLFASRVKNNPVTVHRLAGPPRLYYSA